MLFPAVSVVADSGVVVVRYVILFSILSMFVASCHHDRVKVADDPQKDMHLVLPTEGWGRETVDLKSVVVALNPTGDGCEASESLLTKDYKLGLNITRQLDRNCDYQITISISDAETVVYEGKRTLKVEEFSRKDKFGLIINLSVTEYGENKGYGSVHTIGPVLISWL